MAPAAAVCSRSTLIAAMHSPIGKVLAATCREYALMIALIVKQYNLMLSYMYTAL
jgi:hypothetical protein